MSFKSLVRSTFVIGSSTAVTTVVSILRVKAMALLLGPAGVGLLGVLASVAGVGTTLAAVGTDTTGTRRIALDRTDPANVARVRRTLLLVAITHGLVSAGAIWLLRRPMAGWLLGDQTYATEVGLTGVAVALSLIAGLQIAQLQGLGRVRDLAAINVASSIGGTIIGVAAVWLWGVGGLVLLVLAQPAVAALLASAGAWGLGFPRDEAPSLREDLADWWKTIGQGTGYMASFVALAAAPLLIRSIVVHDLGIEAGGHFHASWTLSVMYVGFLLNAMSADYFPRLSALAGDREQTRALVNDQIQLGLAIGGVALLVILAIAPLLVPLLYSRAFTPAVRLVEWQALGNLMKIAGWPIAFIAMAQGRSSTFFMIELVWNVLLVALVWFGLPYLGLAATGFAFAVACVAFFLLQVVVSYFAYGFVLARTSIIMLASFASAGALTFAAARHSVLLQAITGITSAVALGIASVRFILERLDGNGRVLRLARRGFASIGWPLEPATATARS